MEWKVRPGSALKQKKLAIWSQRGPWTLTLEACRLKMGSWRVYTVDQWSHHFDEEQDADPDPHLSFKVGSGSALRWKPGSGSAVKWCGSAKKSLYCLPTNTISTSFSLQSSLTSSNTKDDGKLESLALSGLATCLPLSVEKEKWSAQKGKNRFDFFILFFVFTTFVQMLCNQ